MTMKKKDLTDNIRTIYIWLYIYKTHVLYNITQPCKRAYALEREGDFVIRGILCSG